MKLFTFLCGLSFLFLILISCEKDNVIEGC